MVGTGIFAFSNASENFAGEAHPRYRVLSFILMDLKQKKLSHSLLMETKKHTTRVKKNKGIMFLRIKKILENQLLGFESKTGCFQKQPPEVLHMKSCSKRFCNIQRKTPVLESLFNFIKSGIFQVCFLLLHQVFSCEIFVNIYFEEHLRTAASDVF